VPLHPKCTGRGAADLRSASRSSFHKYKHGASYPHEWVRAAEGRLAQTSCHPGRRHGTHASRVSERPRGSSLLHRKKRISAAPPAPTSETVPMAVQEPGQSAPSASTARTWHLRGIPGNPAAGRAFFEHCLVERDRRCTSIFDCEEASWPELIGCEAHHVRDRAIKPGLRSRCSRRPAVDQAPQINTRRSTG